MHNTKMMKIAALLFLAVASQAAEFEIRNNGGQTLWIGTLNNPGHALLEGGGFILNPGQQRNIYLADNWAGRFWARTGCDSNSNRCETGDCGNRLQCSGAGGVPPVTLVEILLQGHQGQDFYDISLVDGFNVKASITPIGGSGPCKAPRCTNDLNPGCPDQLRQYGRNGIVACHSSCNKFNQDHYCCRGTWNNPNTCNPNTWEVNSAGYFKSMCPDAYSYAYDDKSSLLTCRASKYLITFG